MIAASIMEASMTITTTAGGVPTAEIRVVSAEPTIAACTGSRSAIEFSLTIYCREYVIAPRDVWLTRFPTRSGRNCPPNILSHGELAEYDLFRIWHDLCSCMKPT